MMPQSHIRYASIEAIAIEKRRRRGTLDLRRRDPGLSRTNGLLASRVPSRPSPSRHWPAIELTFHILAMSPLPAVARPARIATVLGYLALVPFVVGALLVLVVGAGARPGASFALVSYAAVVVSFIGAIHWGLGFRQVDPAPRLFVWGVVPAIVAWLAVLMPSRFGLVAHAVLLIVCYLVDRAIYPLEGVARWLPLRLRLTIVAVASCFVGAAGS